MTTKRRRTPARRPPAKRRPTAAQQRASARRWAIGIRWTIALSGPVLVWTWWSHDVSVRVLWLGVGMIVFAALSSRIVRRVIIVWLSVIGLRMMRWAVCRVVRFPNGPGALDDPNAPWRRWLGIEPV